MSKNMIGFLFLKTLDGSKYRYLYTIKDVPCITYYSGNCEESFIWVSEEYRGKGYGRLLIEGLKRNVVVATPDSYSFYVKLGFRVACPFCDETECDHVIKPDPATGPVKMKKSE